MISRLIFMPLFVPTPVIAASGLRWIDRVRHGALLEVRL